MKKIAFALICVFAGCNQSATLELSQVQVHQNIQLLKKNKKAITLQSGTQALKIQFATKKSDNELRSAMVLKTTKNEEIPFDLGAIDLSIDKNDRGQQVPERLERIQTTAQSTQQGVQVRVVLQNREDLSYHNSQTVGCTIREVVGHHTECYDTWDRVCRQDDRGNEHCTSVPRRECRDIEDVVYRPGTQEHITTRDGDLSNYVVQLVSAQGSLLASAELRVDTSDTDSYTTSCTDRHF